MVPSALLDWREDDSRRGNSRTKVVGEKVGIYAKVQSPLPNKGYNVLCETKLK